MPNGNGQEPATKADLAALEHRLAEAIHDSETRLLRAFYGFTETVQARFRAADDGEANMKKRLMVLEQRLLEVEKRLNMPGQ